MTGGSARTLTVNGDVAGAGEIASGITTAGNDGMIISLSGNWSFTGTITDNVSPVFTGASSNFDGSGVFYHITVNKTGGATLSITGSPAPTYTALTLTAGNVEYNASGNQNVFAGAYPADLILSGSGGKSMTTRSSPSGG